jgi:hypothetical protein
MPPKVSTRLPSKLCRARRIILKARNKKKKAVKINYAVYAQQVLNGMFPDFEITPKAMEIVNIFLNYMCERIVVEASKGAQKNKPSVLGMKELQNAIIEVFPKGDMALHAMRAGIIAARNI